MTTNVSNLLQKSSQLVQIAAKSSVSGQLLRMMEATASAVRDGLCFVTTRYPISSFAITTALSRMIANNLDPEGQITKRKIVKRFFTITLPDNMLLGAVVFFSLQSVKDMPVLLVYPVGLVYTVGMSILIDRARWVAACGTYFISEKLGRYTHIKHNYPLLNQLLERYIGTVCPRDFFAEEPAM